mmetsp:Transcript_53819/g.149304  ORF Transcript_53819/g.149304 Transcript_53819/m.149304 type:complete len:180 (+) Transcript_53819:95-634(+)
MQGRGVVRCEEAGSGIDPTIKLFEAAPEVAAAVGISLVPPPVIDELDKIHVHRTKAPAYSTGWERAAAYHHGLYVPEMYQATKTADEVRAAVASFADKVHKDAPKDACKYLQIEEFRCLQTYRFETQPDVAAKKCMKWWSELQKCEWDQAKFNTGTTYIEGPQMRRRRPYIFYPDFKYA